jgi:hypothetical protein
MAIDCCHGVLERYYANNNFLILAKNHVFILSAERLVRFYCLVIARLFYLFQARSGSFLVGVVGSWRRVWSAKVPSQLVK